MVGSAKKRPFHMEIGGGIMYVRIFVHVDSGDVAWST